MRRQMKLIKAILGVCSENAEPSISQSEIMKALNELADARILEYHLDLCRQAGYLEQDGTRGKYYWRLRWDGHEALDRLA